MQPIGTVNLIEEAKRTLTNPKMLLSKLGIGDPLMGGHLYSGIFKGGIFAYLLAEIDIIPAKYKKLAKDVMLGSGIAAVVLPGSGPSEQDAGRRNVALVSPPPNLQYAGAY